MRLKQKRHLEVVRAEFGTASPPYDEIRKIVIDSQARLDKLPEALKLLNRDEKELDTFQVLQFSEALDFYRKAMPYSSNFQMERIKMKIEDCNKRQTN